MRRTATAITALAALLTAGCSSTDDKPAAKPTSAKLSTTWGPKLEAVTKDEKAICNSVGDPDCADYLTDIALVTGELELEVNEAGGSARYPRTTAELEKVNAAVEAYTDHECLEDENAGIEGSPCPDDAQTIMTGKYTLPLALLADEAD